MPQPPVPICRPRVLISDSTLRFRSIDQLRTH